jgi:hypothetical protein
MREKGNGNCNQPAEYADDRKQQPILEAENHTEQYYY